jgi:hypothetical protein
MLEQVYGKGTMNRTQVFCVSGDFKNEGKTSRAVKDLAVQKLQELTQI